MRILFNNVCTVVHIEILTQFWVYSILQTYFVTTVLWYLKIVLCEEVNRIKEVVLKPWAFRERCIDTGEPENFYSSELFFLYTRKTIDLDSFQPNCIDIFPQQMGFIFWVFYTDNIVHIILLIAYSILLISIWEESAGIVTTVWYHWRTKVPYQCWKRGELVSHLYYVP